jgi:hypothetical protein
MSFEERVVCLSRAFEKRLKSVSNISYKVEVNIGNRKLGIPNSDNFFSRRTYVHKILDNSYTMWIDAPANPDHGGYHQVVLNFFDGKEGITKGYANSPPGAADPFHGRVDSKHDPITHENYYTAWLNDSFMIEFRYNGYYLFPCLLQHKDLWKIEVDNAGRMVTLTSPYPKPFDADEFSGTMKLTLDPQKDFMPLSEEYRWDAILPNKRELFLAGGFVVEDSLLVRDGCVKL